MPGGSTRIGGVSATRSHFRAAAADFKLLGDPTRAELIGILAAGDRNVGGLAVDLGHSQPAVSHHLALLRAARVVDGRRAGKEVFYRLTDKGRRLADLVAAG